MSNSSNYRHSISPWFQLSITDPQTVKRILGRHNCRSSAAPVGVNWSQPTVVGFTTGIDSRMPSPNQQLRPNLFTIRLLTTPINGPWTHPDAPKNPLINCLPLGGQRKGHNGSSFCVNTRLIAFALQMNFNLFALFDLEEIQKKEMNPPTSRCWFDIKESNL